MVVSERQTLYENVGGMPFFEALVDRFYEGVAGDPVLLRLYPEPDDLAPARRRLTLFLAQYWGGPTDHSDERGHGFECGTRPSPSGARRDRWLAHMREAVDALDPPTDVAQALDDRAAAESMRNQMA